MKSILLLCIVLFTFNSVAQESYNRRYYIPQKYIMDSLKKTNTIKFADFTIKEKEALYKKYPLGDMLEYTVTEKVNGKAAVVRKNVKVDASFYNKQTITRTAYANPTHKIKGFVKFDKNKIYINPLLVKDVDKNEITGREDIYVMELMNREKVWLPFTEWTISSVTIPLKYRFPDKGNTIEEEFTTAFNVNFIGGFSYGESSFTYRKEVGNITNTWKLTGALILGAATVELNSSNTSQAPVPLSSGETINLGLVSTGIGATYSFNKLNFGVFYGWDFSLGKDAKKWNYDGLPWLGIGLGYSLFKL